MERQGNRKMYACPKCKSKLESNKCSQCDFTVRWNDSIPGFFTDSPLSKRYEEIGAFSDKLYRDMDNAWCRLAKRGNAFNFFVSSLIMAQRPLRYLDIGCGEGFLLAAITAPEKYGMDISYNALRAASLRACGDFCIGFSEELPYRTEYFDAITSIGVMTHFIDDFAATCEIHRVLRPGGCYLVGIFIPPSFSESIAIKFSEFVYPRLKPIDFLLWMTQKVRQAASARRQAEEARTERQPVERHYTSKQVERIFERAGFVVSKVITKRNTPDAPLAGHHFRIYILHKKNDAQYGDKRF
jgi:ubiquinone/menaquinone biosynthesis C-methylase UbiE